MNVGLGVTAGWPCSDRHRRHPVGPRAHGRRESVEYRHSATSSEEDRRSPQLFADGVEQSAVKRRPLILGALGGALGITLVPAVVLLADMGRTPPAACAGDHREDAVGQPVRLVNDENWIELRPEHLEVGQLVNAQPASLQELHGMEAHQEKAKAAIIVVRMDPNSITIPPSRADWQVSGILAYSKICTHVGCPISLWERQTHHLLCPCHQSTFDLGNSGVVVFGPAGRALPQLPISVDDEGYLITSDFPVPSARATSSVTPQRLQDGTSDGQAHERRRRRPRSRPGEAPPGSQVPAGRPPWADGGRRQQVGRFGPARCSRPLVVPAG